MLFRNLFLFFSIIIFSGAACQQKQQKTPAAATSAFKVTVSTIAGKYDESDQRDGRGDEARFFNPGKMCFDPRNNNLYVADQISIRCIDKDNNVTTYMGRDALNVWDDIRDIDIAPGTAGSLYFTTKYDGLYKIEPTGNTYTLTQLTKGSGNNNGVLSTNDHLDGAYGVAAGMNGDIALMNSYCASLKRIRFNADSPGNSFVEAWAGKPIEKSLGTSWPYRDGKGIEATFSSRTYDICSDGNGSIYLADKDNALIRKVTPDGIVSSFYPYSDADGVYQIAHIKADGVGFIACSKDGNAIYFTAEIGATGGSSPLIRMLQPGKGVISIAGFHDGHKDGDGKDAAFGDVSGMAATPDGKTLYLSEGMNNVVRKIRMD